MKSIASVLATLLMLSGLSYVNAQEHRSASPAQTGTVVSQNAEKGPHGGTLQTVGSIQIETVLKDKGIMFTAIDSEGQVMKSTEASGTLSLRIEQKPKQYTLKLTALKNHALGAAIDMTKLRGKMLHMDVVLDGIEGQTVTFSTSAMLTNTISDAMLISLQKTCPVTGKSLGSMGTPPKIIVKGKPLFVCCAPCSAKVQAQSDVYLAKYYTTKGKQIRPGVFESTLADADAITAQRKCPVMDKPLGSMGVPQKVNVKGKSVFICCAGCAKKLHAQPDKYLALLTAQGIKPPDFE